MLIMYAFFYSDRIHTGLDTANRLSMNWSGEKLDCLEGRLRLCVSERRDRSSLPDAGLLQRLKTRASTVREREP